MIRYLSIVPLILLFAQNSMACEGALLSTVTDDGRRLALKVTEQQLLDAPQWSIEDGEPILSITQAYQAATTWAQVKYSRYDSVSVQSMELRAYNCSKYRDRWLYIIGFQPVIDGNRLFGAGNWAAVLMNGNVIGPIEE